LRFEFRRSRDANSKFSHPVRVGIALGSNLGDRLAHLRQARSRLLALPGAAGPVLDSRLYETEPVDSESGAAAFLNAVIELEYNSPPETLLAALQQIETDMGRPPDRPRNAPRTVDLDILYAADLVLSENDLVVPHPRLHLRRFVLTPLADIRPDLILPGQQQSIAALLAGLNDPATVELCEEKKWI
jgi:2-amino-4-hydroxy-6-hydroxymethyldihydropteridine diphosphokinase